MSLLKKIYQDLEVIDWGQITDFDMIINATSLGLKDKDKIELDFRPNTQNKYFYDLIYKTRGRKTDFISKGEKLGYTTMDGSLMFVYQASEAFNLFNKHILEMNSRETQDVLELLDLKFTFKQ